jgi:hypothetical protein
VVDAGARGFEVLLPAVLAGHVVPVDEHEPAGTEQGPGPRGGDRGQPVRKGRRTARNDPSRGVVPGRRWRGGRPGSAGRLLLASDGGATLLLGPPQLGDRLLETRDLSVPATTLASHRTLALLGGTCHFGSEPLDLGRRSGRFGPCVREFRLGACRAGLRSLGPPPPPVAVLLELTCPLPGALQLRPEPIVSPLTRPVRRPPGLLLRGRAETVLLLGREPTEHTGCQQRILCEHGRSTPAAGAGHEPARHLVPESRHLVVDDLARAELGTHRDEDRGPRVGVERFEVCDLEGDGFGCVAHAEGEA